MAHPASYIPAGADRIRSTGGRRGEQCVRADDPLRRCHGRLPMMKDYLLSMRGEIQRILMGTLVIPLFEGRRPSDDAVAPRAASATPTRPRPAPARRSAVADHVRRAVRGFPSDRSELVGGVAVGQHRVRAPMRRPIMSAVSALSPVTSTTRVIPAPRNARTIRGCPGGSRPPAGTPRQVGRRCAVPAAPAGWAIGSPLTAHAAPARVSGTNRMADCFRRGGRPPALDHRSGKGRGTPPLGGGPGKGGRSARRWPVAEPDPDPAVNPGPLLSGQVLAWVR